MFDSWTTTDIVLASCRALVVLLFLIFGWRDLVMLVRRPARNMGTGLSRIWSVSRTTVAEAWAGRVWLLPLLWLLASVILINVLHPTDESDRMPLVIRTLLSSQEILLLVMMWVMACLSLPRERERKIIITNASKPLSRLEIVLGKITGFSMASAILLAVMGLLSWGILHWENHLIKRRAEQAYALSPSDFSQMQENAATNPEDRVLPPSGGMKLLSEEGALFAHNQITVPHNGLSVVGYIDLRENPPVRYIKGNSFEKAIYRFSPSLWTSAASQFLPPGSRPFFAFYFPVMPLNSKPPEKIEIRVTATRTSPHQASPPVPQQKVITLNSAGEGYWEPDDPGELYSYMNPITGDPVNAGEVTIEVMCNTPGVYLRVEDGAPADPTTGAVPANVDFNVVFVADRSQRGQVPLPNPLMQEFERRGRQQVTGPVRNEARTNQGAIAVEEAVYRFSGADLQHVTLDDKGQFTLSLLMETYKQSNYDSSTHARVQIRTLDALADPSPVQELEVNEKRPMLVKFDHRYLGNSDPTKRSDMIVEVRCATGGHSIYVGPTDVVIELPPTPFFLNLMKSELIILLEVVVLITICVACSVRLGWPVAMLTACICVAFGHFIEFIADIQGVGGLAALNYRPRGSPSMTFQFFDAVTGGIWKMLGAITAIVPNFTLYQPDKYISNLQNLPLAVLWYNLVWTVIFIIPVISLSYLWFRKQELG